MKHIYLICSQGMSTGVLVRKMQDEAKDLEEEVEIKAVGIARVEVAVAEADVILVGPQIRFELDSIRESAQHIPVEMIPPLDYGTLNAKSILKLALSLIN